MIKEIKIENFKSIQSLNLELGRLNVFIGANGSGKSNILEAIAFGSLALMDNLDNGYLEHKGSRFDRKFIKSAFEKENKKDIKIQFSNTDGKFLRTDTIPNSSTWRINKSSSEDITAEEVEKERIPKHDFLITQQHIANLINRETIVRLVNEFNLKNFLIFAPENSILRNFREEGQIQPLGIRGEGLFNHILEISKEKPAYFTKINEHLQLLDWFDSIEIPNDLMFTEKRIKIKDRFLEEGLQYFDQRSANEGFLYLLFYLTLFISDETPKFFAIDNIDNALNPKLGSQLIKILAKLAEDHGKQVILTTHNPAILDGLNLNEDMQRLFVISRNAEGHTKALRIQKEPIENGKPNVKLSEQFLRGYIGGLNF